MRPSIRRSFLALVAILVVMGSTGTAIAQELIFATWGGPWGKAFQQSMIEPFEKATGIKIKVIYGVSATNMAQVVAQRERPQIDAITLTSGDGLAAWQQGLTAALDSKEVPALNDLLDIGVKRDKGDVIYAGMWTVYMGILYRTDKVPFKITSWQDLWDARLKNKVAVTSPKYANAHFFAMINKLAGGTEENVDPGFARMRALGPNLLAEYTDDVTPQRLLAQGEIWAVPMLSAPAYKVIEQGVPVEFVIPKEGAPGYLNVIAMIKGAPHAAEARRFINYVIGAESLTKTCEILKLAPLNRKVRLNPETSSRVLTGEQMKQIVVFNEDAINRNKMAWLERWTREITPLTTR
jgi:spermidine/putrescine-binding protein